MSLPPRPAATASSAAHSNSFSSRLYSTLDRIGYFDSPSSSSSALGSKPPLNDSFTRQFESAETCLDALPDHGAAVWTHILSLGEGNALSAEEVDRYRAVQGTTRRDQQGQTQTQQQQEEADQAALAFLDSLESSSNPTDNDSESLESLEASLTSLAAQSARLDSAIQRTRQTRDQMEQARREQARERKEKEDWADLVAERSSSDHASASSTARQNDIGGTNPAKMLHRDIDRVGSAYAHSLRELEDTVGAVGSVLAQGRLPPPTQTRGAQSKAPTHATNTDPTTLLPAMYSDDLISSALSAESYTDGSGPVSAKAASSMTLSSASPEKDEQSPSPFLFHVPQLVEAYLSADDAWARGLNALFKAHFGSKVSSVPNQDQERERREREREQQQQQQSEEQQTSILMDVVSATPYSRAKRVRESIDMVTTMRSTRSGTNGEDSYSATSTDSPSDGKSSRGLNEGLSASSYAELSAELSRLHSSFPSSQEYWLLCSLHFVGLRARVEAQHGQAVQEEASKVLRAEQVREQAAENGIKARAVQRKLARMLGDSSSSSSDSLPDSSDPLLEPDADPPSTKEPPQTFPQLWRHLRSLQLVEVLRQDLELKESRHRGSLGAQERILQALGRQRARHEALLARWRTEKAGMESLATLLSSLHSEVLGEASSSQRRHRAYAHLKQLHQAARTIQETSRINVDQRNGLVRRMAAMAQSARESVDRLMGAGTEQGQGKAQGVNSKPVSATTQSAQAEALSFDALLSNANHVTLAFPRAHAQESLARQTRAAQIEALDSAATRARRFLFPDRGDVNPADAIETVPSALTRLASDPFLHLRSDVSQQVDQAGEGLNHLVKEMESKSSLLNPPSNPADATTAAPPNVDRELRGAWCEFIMAPDQLEERIAMLQNKLKLVEQR